MASPESVRVLPGLPDLHEVPFLTGEVGGTLWPEWEHDFRKS